MIREQGGTEVSCPIKALKCPQEMLLVSFCFECLTFISTKSFLSIFFLFLHVQTLLEFALCQSQFQLFCQVCLFYVIALAFTSQLNIPEHFLNLVYANEKIILFFLVCVNVISFLNMFLVYAMFLFKRSLLLCCFFISGLFSFFMLVLYHAAENRCMVRQRSSVT